MQGYERETEDLRNKLRTQEELQIAMGNGGVPLASGLCIKCTQNEAILPYMYANQKKVIEKITRLVQINFYQLYQFFFLLLL